MQELLELNRYVHDFTAAMWVCGSILIWLLCRESMHSDLPPESGRLLQRLAKKIALITIPSLAVSLASGVVRAATYKTYEHPEEITTSLVTMLVVKHVLFTALVLWGIAVHVRSRRLGKTVQAP